jgi:Type VI immunity for VRR-NUC
MTVGSDQFVHEKKGAVYLRLAVALTVYFEGTLQEHAAGVEHFYATAVKRIGAHLRFFQTDTMRKPRPIKNRSADDLAALLHIGEKVPVFYKLFAESENAAREASHYSIAINANRLELGGALRLALPVEDVLEREADFVALARELTQKLAFSSGYAGFSFNRAEESDLESTGREQSAALSHRWQGIDVESLSTTLYAIRQGLKSAGWLTLVGRKLVDTLGGAEALARALPGEVTMHTLPFGVLIQAGPRPQLGDVNRREDLPLYRAVGRVLAPVRSPAHPPFLYKSAAEGEDDGWTEKWLARFDR